VHIGQQQLAGAFMFSQLLQTLRKKIKTFANVCKHVFKNFLKLFGDVKKRILPPLSEQY